MLLLLSTAFGAAPAAQPAPSPPPAAAPAVRLLVVGDTGEDTPMARVVAAHLKPHFAAGQPPTWLLATGDLFYDYVPAEATDCVEQVVARYNLYYASLPQDRIVPVLGNHDVTDAEQQSFLAAARMCSVGAFAKLGWSGTDYQSHVKPLDAAGVKLDLAVIDAGFYGEGAPKPKLSFRDDAWRIYTAHYTWRTTAGKCREQDKIPVDWLGAPPMDLWVNGHAHHLDAVQVGPVMALTSGAGMEMRTRQVCPDVTSQFTYVKEGEAPAGGYLTLDLLSATQLRVTPTVCTLEGCATKPSLLCTRTPPARGVVCAPG